MHRAILLVALSAICVAQTPPRQPKQWNGPKLLIHTDQTNRQVAGVLPLIAVSPCRILDTRIGSAPFGRPAFAANEERVIPVPSSTCGIPNTAQAYSLNVTVVPAVRLGYLTLWPTGQTRPLASTLNSPDGDIVANAAIVPSGTGGAISLYVTDRTDVVIDINGYFQPGGSSPALPFYSVLPCRVVDTRPGEGTSGPFGPPALNGGSTRSFPVPLSPCGVPGNALAYSLNLTVVPRGPLGYLTAWPAGFVQPLASTLNSPRGSVVANAAIVPAGSGGSISVFVTNTTDLVIDINGYFAP